MKSKDKTKKIKIRSTLKKSKMSYKIPEYKGEGVFEDKSRFFKETLKNEIL